MDETSLIVRPPLRWRRLRVRMCAATLATASLVGGAGQAAGATVAISSDVERTEMPMRPTSQFPLWISRQDCMTDNDLEFTITLSRGNFSPGDTLSVWVSQSSDCKVGAVRTDPNGRCTPILAQSDLKDTMGIRVPAKEIARALDAPDCEDRSASTLARPVSIYFLHHPASSGTEGDVDGNHAVVWTDTKMDLQGPKPPSSLKVGSGDTRLILEFTQPVDEDLNGYYFYCDGGGASAPGAGAGGTSGAGGGEGTGGGAGGSTAAGGSAVCGSSALVPGEIPDLDSTYRCGSTGKGSAGEATGLRNDVLYAVGIAAYDTIGNPGVLSALACGTPKDVDGFFELYREAGGKAGGGYCSVTGPVGAGRWVPLPLGAVAAGAALGLLRSIRRRRSRSSAEEHG
ncbi:hypothetical protein SOCEGT47_018820 [Sorangium cellulosum]|uniref:Secreted protein n=1 Tax=Sorangium cellulosum TaxID=56 RepID=A0A4P2PXC5_SORCE|nr:hypothetical protein [Sorangium cellulosum]AUX21400.1 hypothetical protein SOCEGT47_018820 [Sorangium cellulosum]